MKTPDLLWPVIAYNVKELNGKRVVADEGLAGSTPAPYAWDRYVVRSPTATGLPGLTWFFSEIGPRGLPDGLFPNGVPAGVWPFPLGIIAKGNAFVEEDIISVTARSARSF